MGEFRTLRLKSILFILIIIFLSFLICATTPPPQKYKYNIDISLNVPTKHKVTVLIYGNGSVLVNKVKNNGETLTFNRLDTININFMPDKNYVVYKILLVFYTSTWNQKSIKKSAISIW